MNMYIIDLEIGVMEDRAEQLSYYSVKRDLLQCQKRPTTVSKETYLEIGVMEDRAEQLSYYSVKRDLKAPSATSLARLAPMSTLTSIPCMSFLMRSENNPCQCQKRPSI